MVECLFSMWCYKHVTSTMSDFAHLICDIPCALAKRATLILFAAQHTDYKSARAVMQSLASCAIPYGILFVCSCRGSTKMSSLTGLTVFRSPEFSTRVCHKHKTLSQQSTPHDRNRAGAECSTITSYPRHILHFIHLYTPHTISYLYTFIYIDTDIYFQTDSQCPTSNGWGF